MLPTTRYFTDQVLRKRPYLTLAMCQAVVENPFYKAPQEDGRIRHWGKVTLPNEPEPRILRVVTLEDGTTIHNAFPDRNFREDAP
ncbi:MAG TPA: hypothetical protein VHG29_05455 [Novosphingobium sp.]|nr:hypothetical protein [Novosphingobium sp.]